MLTYLAIQLIRVYLLIVMCGSLVAISRLLFNPKQPILTTVKFMFVLVIWPIAILSPNGRKIVQKVVNND